MEMGQKETGVGLGGGWLGTPIPTLTGCVACSSSLTSLVSLSVNGADRPSARTNWVSSEV